MVARVVLALVGVGGKDADGVPGGHDRGCQARSRRLRWPAASQASGDVQYAIASAWGPVWRSRRERADAAKRSGRL